VKALSAVDFDVQSGEVHALAGENGAGKSTLMHLLAGVQQPDCGTIEIEGHGQVQISDERQAQQLGVSIVYQERSLFPLLSVAENLFVNNQPATLGVVNRDRLLANARELLAQVNLAIDPRTAVGLLSPAEQQMVEIAKALSLHARIFIFDEPTAALTFAETSTLFHVIRQLTASGAGVIYISHRLEEIFEIANRVSVLKDGCLQWTSNVSETNTGELVSKMVGRKPLYERVARAKVREADPKLEVIGLSDTKLKGISFRAFSGEILGFSGLAGAGRTELALAILGVRPIVSGSIRIDGKAAVIKSAQDAMSAGIGYLPEDRKELGLFLDMNIAENIAAADLGAFGGWQINSETVKETATRFMRKLRISATGIAKSVRKLSGGNQQKVLLSRWLLRDPDILIVDEPTRGIDIGAKAEIYDLLRGVAQEGKAVIVISSELPEVLAISDRIIVMREGRIVAELMADEATEEVIMSYAAVEEATV
jgi:ABC-type sugar transport system ATPase subunit